MSTATLPLTADDLLAMPDAERFELVDGQLLERPMGIESNWVSGEIFGRLREYAVRNSHGWAFPDGLGYACFPDDPDKVRRPDGSYFSRARLPNGPRGDGFCRLAPDLAIEVISPNDVYYDIETKIDEYLEAGVRQVWIISPQSRSVVIHRPGQSAIRLQGQDELAAPDILPGFSCRVADLFPAPPSPASTRA
jgi:Uma2 family endonuclease